MVDTSTLAEKSLRMSPTIAELAGALSKAQAVIEGAIKDSENPFFKKDGHGTKYADLASVWDACRKPLTDQGLSVMQMPTESDSGIGMETMIMHSSGEYIVNYFTMPVSKADAQGVGSAITYARRYALAAMVGVAPEDDDGNAATKAAPKKVNKGTITPNTGAGEELNQTQKESLQKLAANVKLHLADGDNMKAVSVLQNSELDIEEKRYLWTFLESKERTTINALTKK